MSGQDRTLARLGDEPPIVTGGRSGPPDRREISARWLSGTFLTGMTSCVLMGVALLAALDGRQTLTTPPEIMALNELNTGSTGNEKLARLAPPPTRGGPKDRRRMEVSTMTRNGDRNLVRTLPFALVRMALAAGHTTDRSYPRFDPLSVFAEENRAVEALPTGTLYGARVESDVSLRTIDFPFQQTAFDEKSVLSALEVEQVVRNTAAILNDGMVQVAALHHVDPQRFGDFLPGQSVSLPANVRIVPENVSIAPRPQRGDATPGFAEELLTIREKTDIGKLLARSGYDGWDAKDMAEAISTVTGSSAMEAGQALRLGIETRGEVGRIVRASIYTDNVHTRSIAVNDRGQYLAIPEPEVNPAIAAIFDDQPRPVRARSDLPSVYDGIYRAALSYGLTEDLTRNLVKLLAADVDFQSRLNPADRLEVFFSQPDENDQATEDSQMLYIRANFGKIERRFYRFQTADGVIDYYDEEGRSARQFLLRNPVPNGEFRSGFGGRRHPILGYVKMHTGVDWRAPSGTPIIAAGNGKVEKASWAGGYGRQTIIRHANGYVTSYNHQSGFAKGVAPGARVRQGQIIGYVGSSGLSTGPHLHYELIVNGTKVDPMRVRLPTGKVLKGDELAAFQAERDRIDALLADEEGKGVKVASG